MGYRVALAFSVLLVVSVIAGASLVQEDASPVETAEAHHGPPSWSNATFLPAEPQDRRPGEEAATYNIYGGQGIDYKADFLKVESPGLDWSNCNTGDLRAEGIAWNAQERYERPPRGDDTTTRSNESIVQYSESPQYREDGIWVDWYEDEDALGDAPRFNATDEIVVQYGDCFQNPDEVGWYQMDIFVNGTNQETGEYVEHEYKSHYFAICEECDNREEAEDELGPPPGQGDDGADGEEPADTPTPTDEPADDDGAGDDGAGDDGAGDDGAGDDDDGAGDDGAGDDDDGTGDDGAGDDSAGDDSAGDDDDGTGDDGAGDDDGSTDGEESPEGDGVGFGAIVAVVALLAAALLARRTDD